MILSHVGILGHGSAGRCSRGHDQQHRITCKENSSSQDSNCAIYIYMVLWLTYLCSPVSSGIICSRPRAVWERCSSEGKESTKELQEMDVHCYPHSSYHCRYHCCGCIQAMEEQQGCLILQVYYSNRFLIYNLYHSFLESKFRRTCKIVFNYLYSFMRIMF